MHPLLRGMAAMACSMAIATGLGLTGYKFHLFCWGLVLLYVTLVYDIVKSLKEDK
jgi:hypothetical protein